LTAKAARVEADRCLECGGPHAPAPCAVACPANVDVPGFVAAVAAGDPGSAARTILAENILGGTCARVCPVEILCQRDCVLVHEGRLPIEIGALQRFATDWAYANGLPLRTAANANGKHVAVIGAGPAGLAAAGELAARGFAVTVYDERDDVGGLVRYAIAPYRQTSDPLPDEARLLIDLGVEFRLGERVDAAGLEALATEMDVVVLAVGMGADADVKYENEHLDGVWDSLPFIKRLKSEEPPVVGERVAVIGGGNTAVDVAVEARRLGAHVSLLLYRRTEQEMPAYEHEVELARREGVEIRFLTSPVGFVGTNRVEGIRCTEMRLGAPDESGRCRPEPVPGSEFVIPVDTVVKAIGQQPRSEFLSLLACVDEDGRTANPKVFAAGDAVNGGASVVQAVAEAKRAAAAIDETLR
jgi:glutamate synthase (NADPH/NADH) small chain